MVAGKTELLAEESWFPRFYTKCMPIFDQEVRWTTHSFQTPQDFQEESVLSKRVQVENLQNEGHTHEQYAAFQELLGPVGKARVLSQIKQREESGPSRIVLVIEFGLQKKPVISYPQIFRIVSMSFHLILPNFLWDCYPPDRLETKSTAGWGTLGSLRLACWSSARRPWAQNRCLEAGDFREHKKVARNKKTGSHSWKQPFHLLAIQYWAPPIQHAWRTPRFRTMFVQLWELFDLQMCFHVAGRLWAGCPSTLWRIATTNSKGLPSPSIFLEIQSEFEHFNCQPPLCKERTRANCTRPAKYYTTRVGCMNTLTGLLSTSTCLTRLTDEHARFLAWGATQDQEQVAAQLRRPGGLLYWNILKWVLRGWNALIHCVSMVFWEVYWGLSFFFWEYGGVKLVGAD